MASNDLQIVTANLQQSNGCSRGIMLATFSSSPTLAPLLLAISSPKYHVNARTDEGLDSRMRRSWHGFDLIVDCLDCLAAIDKGPPSSHQRRLVATPPSAQVPFPSLA